MVLFDLFSQKICIQCKFFVKKDGFFRPAGACPERRRMGRYLPSNPGSPAACQHWPFRGVRSFRVVRGPNSHRVRPVYDPTHAVYDQAHHFAGGSIACRVNNHLTPVYGAITSGK
jgi:hypothetical protein